VPSGALAVRPDNPATLYCGFGDGPPGTRGEIALSTGVAGNPRLNQPDGIHPTAEGYGVVVDRLWPFLEPMLRR